MIKQYFVWTKGEDSEKLLSTHFKAGEFECPCSSCNGKEQRISVELVEDLEWLRTRLGQPIRITSGYRCERYQLHLGEIGYPTALKSQHPLGEAVDVTTFSAHLERLYELAKERFMAIGKALTWLHLDERRDKVRQWKYTA